MTKPAAPTILPTHAGASTVVAKGVVPHARVEVFVAPPHTETYLPAGSVTAHSDSVNVPLNRPLAAGDQVQAQQTVQGTPSDRGPTTVTQP